MSDRVTAVIERLSGRERALLLLLAVAGVPLVLYVLAARPLLDARVAAERRLAEAVAERRWVAERGAEWEALGPSRPGRDAVQGAGLSALEVAIAEAGLRQNVRMLQEDGNGRVRISFGSAPFERVAGFLDRSDLALGYDLGAMRLTAAEAPGQVEAAIELVPR